ncbi:K+-transporting ATPase, B subunit [Pseudarthrobacter chlorophenolicus A6]|uniref:Potassium-transporting ATPase ATP-binding subunit n=1 Tax=Pseudarthrobacter chlorophenolicus (strain ATCC 700700 / DSM 12829 / CIP 107037 / JCM 12360 / KCTC 9906 / NCIMB 13794 / A6) TaxID=452863 RepID=B8H6W8_PSECP|nr:potassium-transporting ATPase subunit KdpB [Pseudarthrobacter chlorophenolicus]ACL39689.1 K+-transporting ATPase, B subunit [Pseudarthrobacter chlorophenolicus A6]SDQ95296.1 K+-transporting ATPase ATPase B chain [Pseudarthrobacter chlorophenolicus]
MTTTHNPQRPAEPVGQPHGAPGHVPAPRVTELSGHAYKRRRAFNRQLVLGAVPQSFIKLNPRQMAGSPVMFTVLVGTAVSAVACGFQIAQGSPDAVFSVVITAWLLLTVLFANFSEALAEGRGKAQADSLREGREGLMARRLRGSTEEQVPAPDLRKGDLVVCEIGDTIPSDGEIIEGLAMVDESAITGESAPVIREAGGDRSAVTGGTRVISDRITVRITAEPGSTFIDRMIALVEGSERQKTPNEIALHVLLVALTIVFLAVTVALVPFANLAGGIPSPVVLVALLVCLIPTTIGALVPAIGIAGMDRLVRHNVLATSGRAVETAGDITTLLLDKTGTITFGNRRAVDFLPAPGVPRDEFIEAARLSSLADETPEGRSIVDLAVGRGAAGPGLDELARERPGAVTAVDFTAVTRMSGLDDGPRRYRKGAASAVSRWIFELDGILPDEARDDVDRISRGGGTPLVVAVADGGRARVLGTVHLADVVKPGIAERFAALRRMGIRTVMITGDNKLTAAAIAREAGVDDYLAEATPEDKLARIRQEQAAGQLVAMTGDGTNDAPALAAADVGVAMNSGTQAAKEAANMVDLDSDPTKLIDVVAIGKQLLITRGSLTTFSVANDIAKYFAIIPALFVAVYPGLDVLNIMGLTSPKSAVLSAVIFNAVIIVLLVPLALRGVRYRPVSAQQALHRNLLIYGAGGIIIPFIGIKIIDLLLAVVPGLH